MTATVTTKGSEMKTLSVRPMQIKVILQKNKKQAKFNYLDFN
jgi:hypothetical protein